VGTTRGAGRKRDFLKGRPGEITRNAVSLRYVDVPDAELRLEQALELLLSGTLSQGEIIAGQDIRGDQNGDDSDADGDAT